jgi:MFS superfamily sulfate permease-like transporter
MLDIGFAELLIFFVPMWALAALVVYWVVRLAVRHGTLDAYRLDRTDRRIAEMPAAVRRQEAASGEDRA